MKKRKKVINKKVIKEETEAANLSFGDLEMIQSCMPLTKGIKALAKFTKKGMP